MADSRKNRGAIVPPRPHLRRIACAAAAAGLAPWLVSWVFPYLEPTPRLQSLLREFPLDSPVRSGWVSALLSIGPYLALGVAVYVYLSTFAANRESTPATPDAAPTARWRPVMVSAAVIVVLVWLAHASRLVVDDAYISFRYARNWAEGAGPVYNVGERVEGYTNFLWVVLLAAGVRLGCDPVGCSLGLGLACFAGTLTGTERLGRRLLPDGHWATALVLLVGTQFSVLSFATGGLETSLQTVLLVLGTLAVVAGHQAGSWGPGRQAAVSVVCAAGVLTRMDFALFAIVLCTAMIVSTCSSSASTGGQPRTASARPIGALLFPAAAIVGVWLAWKVSYYGSVLPNTYYAKRPEPGAATAGMAYLWDFCTTYRYTPALAVAVVGIVVAVRRRHVVLVVPAAVVAWAAYLVWIGGDFIEFRLLVPVVPLFLLWVLWTVAQSSLARRFHAPVIACVWLAYGSLHHYQTFGWAADRAEPVAQLRWQTEDALWAEAGEALCQWFGGEDVIIATAAAGILPYHARLRTVDMHGLTDPVVARMGRAVSRRSGHQRLADTAHLRKRGVHLAIGHPKIEPVDALDDLPAGRLAPCIQAANPPADEAVVIAVPITARHVLLAWYLTPHPAIDRAIAAGAWRTFRVRPG